MGRGGDIFDKRDFMGLVVSFQILISFPFPFFLFLFLFLSLSLSFSFSFLFLFSEPKEKKPSIKERLQGVVNLVDPNTLYTDFVKIGEGASGSVFSAVEIVCFFLLLFSS